MKSTSFLIILLLSCTICLSQSELAKKGTITLANNQKIDFNNLRLVDGKFVFFDVKSGNESILSLNEIKYVEDDKQSRVFTNKSVETIADTEKAEQDRNLAILRKQKADEDAKRKIEEEERNSLKLYPNGIYKTKEDFVNRKISSTYEVVPKGLIGFEKLVLNEIVDNCFFYYVSSDEKVKNVFAISYKGHLYFQIYSILENRNKTDRAQTNDFPNSFVRVISGGQNYYYLEADLANAWAQGIAYGGVGGASGAALANSMLRGKGIVWDIKNKEFNTFKNCQDYNDFIKDKYPEGVQECKKQQPNIVEVRKAIEKIK